MRTLLSLLAALLAGVLAVLATVGALVDEAAHRPTLVRDITAQVASDAAVRAAVPGAVTDTVEDAIPDAIPDPLVQVAEDVVRPLAQRVADDPDVVQGWSDTADEARRAWLHDLEDAKGSPDPVPGGTFDIPFGPVAQSGIAAALGDIEADLRADRFDLPGQGLVEGLLGIDVGDWAADTLIGPLYDRAAQLRDGTELTMAVTVPGLADTDRRDVARVVDASAHWVWAAVTAAVLALAALLIAPHRRRGIALALAGGVALAGALWLGQAIRADAFAVAAPEGATPGVAALVRAVQTALPPALDAALAPYASTLATVGWVALAAGVLLALVELLVGRRRPRHARPGARSGAVGAHAA